MKIMVIIVLINHQCSTNQYIPIYWYQYTYCGCPLLVAEFPTRLPEDLRVLSNTTTKLPDHEHRFSMAGHSTKIPLGLPKPSPRATLSHVPCGSIDDKTPLDIQCPWQRIVSEYSKVCTKECHKMAWKSQHIYIYVYIYICIYIYIYTYIFINHQWLTLTNQ